MNTGDEFTFQLLQKNYMYSDVTKFKRLHTCIEYSIIYHRNNASMFKPCFAAFLSNGASLQPEFIKHVHA